MIAKHKLMELVRDWLNAWNSRNIERLMSHYQENAELSSPTIVKRWNIATGRITGKEALRKHFLKGFEDINHSSFELLGVLTGVNGIVLIYRRGAFGMAADVITLDENGKAITIDSYHSQE
ncbi:MAG TPA: nuclear transport factor 2 family protein [Puia sp.]|nr:nuclear transport factor 2 family protein [Puia sp.]